LKKVLYTNFIGADEVIAQMLGSKEFKKAITRSNLYKFWKKIAGEKFAQNSRPFSMTAGSVMIIACKNSAVAQELSFHKKTLLEKFQPYLKSLELTVKDFKFDPKKWTEEEA